MAWPDVPEDLLAGPRGRRLCFELACPTHYRDGDWPDECASWFSAWGTGDSVSRQQLGTELAAAVAATDLDSLAATTDPVGLLKPLTASVEAAMYWQPADGIDDELASPDVADRLIAVARAVTRAPAAAWWSTPVDRDNQYYAQFLADDEATGRTDDAPDVTGAAAKLAEWLAETLDDEHRAAKRPADPAANWSGNWWSTPIGSGLVSTTRSLPGLGAAELPLQEDSLGRTGADCWPLRPDPAARVYEIYGPDDWTALVAGYPLDVSKARRHDWWRVTGMAGAWLVPDFTAVAADYDAVHLTVGGYLTTAGRGLLVGHSGTVLAGWNPDETYWLADVLAAGGTAVRWVTSQDDEPFWSAADG
jgi:hypothetical protein